MNAFAIAGIVVGSVAVYVAAGFCTGRSWARFWYEIDKSSFTEGTFILGALLWPLVLPVWWVARLRNRSRYTLREALIPELRQEVDEIRQRQLEYKLREREREIERLHSELGLK